MTTRTLKSVLVAGGLAALLSLSSDPTLAATSSFFGSEPPDGWFWYSVTPDPEPQPEPKPEAKPKPKPMPARPPALKKAVAPDPKEPTAYSAVWIRENLPKYLNRAIDNPTRKNVLAYMYLQRLTIDKSQRFADAVEVAVKTTPALDENNRRPISSMGARLANRGADRATKRAMTELSQQLGVWFFYSSGCDYCASQSSVLKGVEEIYGIPVTAISMDGGSPPPGFASARSDEGQANRLDIDGPMGLVLVNPKSRKVVPLSHGLLARDQLVSRILLAAKKAGWIDEDAYNRTRPMRADQLLSAGFEGSAETGAPTTDNLPVSPDDVLDRLVGQLEGGGTQR